jgi:signal transduction histidine kinase
MGKIELILIIVIFNIVIASFIIGIVIYIKQYKKKKQLHENEIKMNIELHKQELLSTQLEMQLQTMQHIGREIHDNLGQKLTLASLYTQQLSYENKAPQINDKIESISTIINESLQELRRLSKSLTDDNIAEKDFVTLLSEECNKIKELKKCAIQFTTSHKNINLDYQAKNILLRIVQEFFQNSIKHSNCTLINVNLAISNSTVNLLLNDNGVGFDNTINYTGIGLKNMAKRVEILNGTFELNSKINKGTSLSLNIPLQHEA